jgi:hypothetical protein
MKKRIKAKAKSKAPMKVKGVSMAGLKPRQAMAMKKHSVHHTGKHIKSMVAAMKKGATFGQSHKIAMKKAGK